MYEWNYYGAASVEGGLWRVGDYIYNWYPQSNEIFIYASPTKNYGSTNQVKVADTKTRDAIVAEIAQKGAKLTKDEARAAAADIEARNKSKASSYTAPVATTTDTSAPAPTSLIPTWIYDPNGSWYTQGYLYALLAVGGIAVALNWDSIKGMLGMNESAAPALANPRKNKMKKYSNPRMNRKHRRKNREVEEEVEVEEIDEDEE